MLCRVEMPTNEQIYGRFYRWKLMNMGGFSTKFLLLILPILVAAFTIYSYAVHGGSTFALILLLTTLAYSAYTLFIRPNSEFKRKGGVALQTEVYIFTETGFTRNLRSEESGVIDHSSSQYDVLVRAVETPKDFYLFYGPKQAYLIDKEYFTKGSAEELRATLTEKLGTKFKTKCK